MSDDGAAGHAVRGRSESKGLLKAFLELAKTERLGPGILRRPSGYSRSPGSAEKLDPAVALLGGVCMNETGVCAFRESP